MIVENFLSLKGTSLFNEDIVGFYQNYFWLMDGVTDLFDMDLFQEGSDSKKLVSLINEVLPNHLNDELSLKSILKNTLSEINHQTKMLFDSEAIQKYKLPTFTIIFIRKTRNNQIEYMVLGDSSLIIEGQTIISDHRISRFSENDLKKFRKIFDSEKRKEILIDTRKKLNQKNGYWIGSLDAYGLDYALVGTLQIKENQRLILCSDGFLDYFKFKNNILELEFTTENIIRIISDIFKNEDKEKSNKFKKRDDISILTLRMK
ncbi:PP2C family serine/threonine-protein phosphatase [Streptococcus zalophi]|uniref:Protein phosphatase 2C family protein n=1 Tax=Streptococcus zalophi TaxID=640031 RepID=A0A934UDJ1_9STRE|nr:PP2C family serine/threonine-protein phosphatase [Streptococcus zalophi]MBJ8349728.1 protein phosphatase 2C family protein [Streptococcus zalophi]